MSLREFSMFLSLLALMGGWVWLIAPAGEKRRATLLAVLGLFVALGKIWLFQQTPQWQDINPDSVTYDLHARALALHWEGVSVSVEEYRLRGLTHLHDIGLWKATIGLTGLVWEQADTPAWNSVLGTYEWLYTAYVASWYWLADASQNMVIFSNAIWSAFFPVAAYVLALALGASRKVASLAAALALMDPLAGVNASSLLKDTLISFLAMSCLCIVLRITREGRSSFILYFAIFAAFLSSGRYGAFFGLLCAMVLILVYFVGMRQMKQVCHFAVMLLLALAMSNIFQHVPNVPALSLTQSFFPLTGSVRVFKRDAGDVRADETVVRWKKAFADNAPLAVVKSVAHTLFAPYPWVAISPGLTWNSFSELYYPGMILWMLCLPGIFRALWRGIRTRDPAFWLLALFLASQWACYTFYFGEWSTRQRVFCLPAFFALAAIGYAHLCRWYKRRGSLSPDLTAGVTQ